MAENKGGVGRKSQRAVAEEPMPFDDALRVLLAAGPQHRTAKDKLGSKESPAPPKRPNRKVE